MIRLSIPTPWVDHNAHPIGSETRERQPPGPLLALTAGSGICSRSHEAAEHQVTRPTARSPVGAVPLAARQGRLLRLGHPAFPSARRPAARRSRSSTPCCASRDDHYTVALTELAGNWHALLGAQIGLCHLARVPGRGTGVLTDVPRRIAPSAPGRLNGSPTRSPRADRSPAPSSCRERGRCIAPEPEADAHGAGLTTERKGGSWTRLATARRRLRGCAQSRWDARISRTAVLVRTAQGSSIGASVGNERPDPIGEPHRTSTKRSRAC
jgi:hypothetical protein